MCGVVRIEGLRVEGLEVWRVGGILNKGDRIEKDEHRTSNVQHRILN